VLKFAGRTFLAICFLVLTSAFALGQSKIHLEFETAGPRTGWIGDLGSTPPADAQKWDNKSVDLTSKGAGYVQVLDISSGNLAAKKVADIGKGWVVKDTDFVYIGHVQIKVVHDGEPVEFASVTLNDGARSIDQVIDASSNGTADFYGLKPGTLKVTTRYRAGNSSKNASESFDVPLKRDSAIPQHVVTITEDVPTVQGSGDAVHGSGGNGHASAGNAPSPRKSNPVGDILVYLLAILFAALVIFLGFVWLTRNPQKSRDALNKLGVALHDPATPDAASSAATQTTPLVPPPQEKIMLEGAEPTPLGAATLNVGPTPATPMSAGVPAFVAEDGRRFDLGEGSFIVGRDASADMSLPNENSISRKHAQITRSGNSIVVKDLGSTNGTFVNGLKLNGETTLRPGDTVQFGAVRFRFES